MGAHPIKCAPRRRQRLAGTARSLHTRAGARYDNDYCYVCRFDAAGKLVALTEYMDTALAERVLAPPS